MMQSSAHCPVGTDSHKCSYINRHITVFHNYIVVCM